MNQMSIRTYSELMKLKTFEERYNYLKLDGIVGEETFGFDRIFNQRLYGSDFWKKEVRPHIILRDNGCDLGVEDREIQGRVIIHHMNPITLEDIENNSDFLYNPEYLICVSHDTHNAIHYGDESLLVKDPVFRTKNDTCPWKK